MISDRLVELFGQKYKKLQNLKLKSKQQFDEELCVTYTFTIPKGWKDQNSYKICKLEPMLISEFLDALIFEENGSYYTIELECVEISTSFGDLDKQRNIYLTFIIKKINYDSYLHWLPLDILRVIINNFDKNDVNSYCKVLSNIYDSSLFDMYINKDIFFYDHKTHPFWMNILDLLSKYNLPQAEAQGNKQKIIMHSCYIKLGNDTIAQYHGYDLYSYDHKFLGSLLEIPYHGLNYITGPGKVLYKNRVYI